MIQTRPISPPTVHHVANNHYCTAINLSIDRFNDRNRSIHPSNHPMIDQNNLYVTPYVTNESEAHNGRD